MNRVPVSLAEVSDPTRLRDRTDSLDKRLWDLLVELNDLKAKLALVDRQSAGINGITDDERQLLAQLSIGSTSNAAPAQNALVPSVDALPPVAISVEGQVVKLNTDGQQYRFDGSTWVTYTTGTHNLLSATHPDTVAGTPVLGDLVIGNATPAWAKLAGNITAIRKVLAQTGTGAVSAPPSWSQLAAADLSDAANIALLNAINSFSVNQKFTALSALMLGGAAVTHGASHQFVFKDEEIALSTAGLTTDSTADLLAGNGLVLPVLAFITQTISGGGVTLFRVGDATTSDRFRGDDPNLTVGAGFWMFKHWSGSVTTDAAGPTQPGAAKIRVTVNAIPTQGKIRLVSLCLAGTPPTS